MSLKFRSDNIELILDLIIEIAAGEHTKEEALGSLGGCGLILYGFIDLFAFGYTDSLMGEHRTQKLEFCLEGLLPFEQSSYTFVALEIVVLFFNEL